MISLTPPSKSSVLSWTSSKNPSEKTLRMSSARRVGTKGVPTLAVTRPRITASWTRRFPWTAMSLMMIWRAGDCCVSGGGVWAEPTPALARSRANKTERRVPPRAPLKEN